MREEREREIEREETEKEIEREERERVRDGERGMREEREREEREREEREGGEREGGEREGEGEGEKKMESFQKAIDGRLVGLTLKLHLLRCPPLLQLGLQNLHTIVVILLHCHFFFGVLEHKGEEVHQWYRAATIVHQSTANRGTPYKNKIQQK